MISGCPGAKGFRQPEPKIIKCPFCDKEIEAWTDEFKSACPNCKETIIKSDDSSCLNWCRYAKQCAGVQLYDKFMESKSAAIRQGLLRELEEYFGDDKKRIRHARNVMHFAEELLKREKGDWQIVIPASILHDVGIKESEKKYNSSDSSLQEKEGAGIARKILLKLGLRKEDIDEICDIIASHHSPGVISTKNFKILYDADRLVNFRDEMDVKNKSEIRKAIDQKFITKTGKEFAVRIYL